jgi:hypothetical protein
MFFDEKVFPFSELHANAGARLRFEIELLSSTLFDFAMVSGNTTVSTTDEINSSANPAANRDQNFEENPAIVSVFHVVSHGEAGAHSGADTPAPAQGSTSVSLSESASGSVG